MIREKRTTLTLAALSVLAWAAVLWQWQAMGCRLCQGMSVACPMCMGVHLPLGVSLSIFLGMWSTMMAAMMLPSVTPMVLLFGRVSESRRQSGSAASPVWIFAAGYLFAWALTGIAGFAVARSVQWALTGFPSLARFNHIAAGSTLLAAGIYQLSPWKDSCLRHCRSPLDFLTEGWRDGHWGALRMGTSHALYCIGCCWGLMAVMFAVGLMNLAWMAGLTVVMAAEKIGARGVLVGRLAGAVFLMAGAIQVMGR